MALMLITSEVDMTGWIGYTSIMRLKEEAESLGFEIGPGSYQLRSDTLCLRVPEDPSSYQTLPVYTRGVTIFEGSVEDMKQFLNGYIAHQRYMHMMGLSKIIKKAEDRHAGKVIAQKLGMVADKKKVEDDIPF